MIKNFVLDAIIIGYYRKHQFNALKGHDTCLSADRIHHRLQSTGYKVQVASYPPVPFGQAGCRSQIGETPEGVEL